ncbi:ATP-dependent DNA helicase PIF1 [Linum perenne]
MPTHWTSQLATDDLISQQLQYDTSVEARLYNSYEVLLNTCQRTAHDAVVSALSSSNGKLFFLYGHGGTGKTYLYNCLLSKVRSEGKIALVVASSGIAATLLPGGVTAHSRFRIPLDVDSTSTCTIKKGTSLARLMKSASLIVWDEAQGVNYKPFGGKTVLLGGDFRQTLPIVVNGGREDNLNASLTRSYLWNHCTLLELKTNMRIIDSTINAAPIFEGLSFPEWVLAIGDGRIPTFACQNNSFADWINIPPCFLLPTSDNPIAAIVNCVYTDLSANFQSVAYIRTRAIVTPTNQTVSSINDYVLSQIPGMEKVYLSSLRLKPYSIVMLLRNLNPSAGLCNGTRILLTDLGEHTLRGLIIGGSYERRQYPVRLCYAMTINKSQGQTLEHIGIYLPSPVFSHGQLYVALSRARSVDGIHIVLQNDSTINEAITKNIVYQEIFEDLQATLHA